MEQQFRTCEQFVFQRKDVCPRACIHKCYFLVKSTRIIIYTHDYKRFPAAVTFCSCFSVIFHVWVYLGITQKWSRFSKVQNQADTNEINRPKQIVFMKKNIWSLFLLDLFLQVHVTLQNKVINVFPSKLRDPVNFKFIQLCTLNLCLRIVHCLLCEICYYMFLWCAVKMLVPLQSKASVRKA